VRDIESQGERNRGLYILKSRGMAHSNQVREFVLSSDGIQLVDVYIGEGGVLTGSSRAIQEAKDRREEETRGLEVDRKQRELETKRLTIEAQIAALKSELRAYSEDLEKIVEHEAERSSMRNQDRAEIARRRHAD